MKIEIWSDFSCPFCFIGKRRLEKALEDFPRKNAVTIKFKSYELDPQAKHIPGKNYAALLAGKYGMSLQKAKEMIEQVKQQAKEVGLTYDMDNLQNTNTFDAHRLVKFAEKKGKGKEMAERLFHAFFTEAKLISDHHTLEELAHEVGLNRREVLDTLASCKHSKYVREEEELAREIGVQGVPFFVFNEKYAVSGAQPSQVFLDVLQQVWERENEKPILQTLTPENPETSYCTDEGCTIKEKDK